MPTDYRLSQPLVVRLLGGFLAFVGVAIFVLALLVALLSLPSLLVAVGAVLAVVGVFVVGTLLTRRAVVVRLDDVGYQVHFVRGAGVKQARWADVEDVLATKVGADPCVVLRLRDGRTTTVPVRVLAGKPDDFVKDLQEHLNKGHGYRRIN